MRMEAAELLLLIEADCPALLPRPLPQRGAAVPNLLLLKDGFLCLLKQAAVPESNTTPCSPSCWR